MKVQYIPVTVNLLELSAQTATQNQLIYRKETTLQLNLNTDVLV